MRWFLLWSLIVWAIAGVIFVQYQRKHPTITVPVIYKHMPDARATGVSDFPFKKWNVGVTDANGNNAHS